MLDLRVESISKYIINFNISLIFVGYFVTLCNKRSGGKRVLVLFFMTCHFIEIDMSLSCSAEISWCKYKLKQKKIR